MLHMVVANHGPDTCAATVPTVAKIAKTGFQQMGGLAKRLGISVQGTWINIPAHAIYMLIDAPNAHAVCQLCRDIHLMDWNTVAVNPVISLQESIDLFQ